MAIEWYRIDAGLKTHPKRTRLHRMVGCSKLEALAYITLLFTFAATHAEDGGIERFSQAEIEDACEWAGKEGILYKAFIDAGFIDETTEGKIIHDWYERNWKHVESDRRKKKAWREAKKSNKQDGDPNKTDTRPDEDVPETSEDSLRPAYERTNERTNELLSKRDSVESAIARFIELRAAVSAYAGVSYAVGDSGRAAAVNLIHSPKYPSKEEFEDAARNFFESDFGTFNHDASSFFGKFHAWLSGPIKRSGSANGKGATRNGNEARKGGGDDPYYAGDRAPSRSGGNGRKGHGPPLT